MADEGKSETASLRLRRWAALGWAVVGGLAVLAKLTLDLPQAAPRWLKGLQWIPEYVFYIALVVALVSAFFLLFRGLRAQQRLAEQLEDERATRQRLEAELLPAPLPAPPVTVPQERVERLREFYSAWGPTVQFAYEALYADIYKPGEREPQEKSLLAYLVFNHIGRPCIQAKEALDATLHSPALTGSTTEEAFDDLRIQLHLLINNRYQELLRWILLAGSVILGEDILRASPWYKTLYDRHQLAVQELWRVRDRTDIGGISQWHQTLKDALPPPVKLSGDPQSSTASE